jgi:nitrous oxidase accessory protein NosD
MDQHIRKRLCDLIAQQGQSIVHDVLRCEALLRDFCGPSTKEMKLLLIAIREQIPQDLLITPLPPWPSLQGRLLQRLRDGVGIEATAATWAVDSWAIALGVITHDVTTQSGPLWQATGSPATYNAIPVPASHSPALIVSKIGPEHCHSIGEAIGKAKPGSRILVYPGLYAEQVVIDKDLEIVGEGNGHDIIIAPPDNVSCVVMRTAYAVVRNVSIRRRKTSDEKQVPAVVAGQGRLVLQHLAITCPASAAVLATGAAASCSMHHVSLTGCRWGVWATDGAEAVVEGSTISDCEGQGIEIRDDAWCTVRSCDVHDCGAAGIAVSPKGELRCEDTAVRDNRGLGIQVRSNAKNRITGCEIVRNSMHGVVLDEAALARIRHTQFSGNGGAEFSQVEVSEKSSVILQACVISAGASHGMHVSTGSAATIEDSTLHAFGQECLSVFDGSSVTCDRSRFLHSESFCVSVFQKCQAILRHCEIGQSATRSAIIVQAESSATLDHCQVREAKQSGVYSCDRSKATVSASRVHECGSNGMAADKKSTLKVEKCVIEGCNGVGVRLSQESTGEISDTAINGLYAFYVASDSRRSGSGNSHNGTALLQACCEKCNTITEASKEGVLKCCNPECGVRFRIDADGDVLEYFTDEAVTEGSETEDDVEEEDEEEDQEEHSDEDDEEEEHEQEYDEDEEDEEVEDEEQDEDDDQDSGDVEFESPVELVCDECGEEWDVMESGVTMCPHDDCYARYIVDADGDVTRIEDGGPYDEDPDPEQDEAEEEWEDDDEEDSEDDDEVEEDE